MLINKSVQEFLPGACAGFVTVSQFHWSESFSFFYNSQLFSNKFLLDDSLFCIVSSTFRSQWRTQ